MKYSIFKDNKPKNTVKNIKKILKKYKINLNHIKSNGNCKYPCSVRVFVENLTKIGTNGKGANIENAIASGYAEFMERFQNCALFDNMSTTYKKTNILSNEIENSIDLNILKKIEFFLGINSDLNSLLTDDFLNIKNGQLKKIPYIIMNVQGSNGMCAGNTPEEALVQGFCEIFERYAIKEVFSKQIAMPDIPEEEYIKYEVLADLIQYYKNCGYNIKVKDASLDKGLPVVCVVFEDKDNNVFYPVFGSSPSLPIAIERCLTEFAQGNDVSNKVEKMILSKKTYPYLTKNNLKSIENHASTMPWLWIFSRTPVIERNCFLNKIFYSTFTKYIYNKKNFISLKENWNNKKLIKYVYKKALSFNQEIYIKDASFLGFSSYMIYIPNISLDREFSKPNIKLFLNHFKADYFLRNKSAKITLDLIWDFLICKTKWMHNKLSAVLPKEHVLLLCSILRNDIDNIIFYCNFLLEKSEYDKTISNRDVIFYKITRDYYSQANRDYFIKQKYNSHDIENFYNIVNNLSLAAIINLMSMDNINEMSMPDIEKEKRKELFLIIDEAQKKYKPNYNKIKKSLR